MTTIAIEKAQKELPKLIRGLAPGDEIVITENGKPVARIVGAAQPRAQRKLGTMRGSVLHMAPDFDAPLEDFREYMQ